MSMLVAITLPQPYSVPGPLLDAGGDRAVKETDKVPGLFKFTFQGGIKRQ